ncbi:MAG: hypothetical protein RL291_2011, partial [Pseudomonadota bacterium]
MRWLRSLCVAALPLITAAGEARACTATGGLGERAREHTLLAAAAGSVELSKLITAPGVELARLDDKSCTMFDWVAVTLRQRAPGLILILGEIHDSPHHHAL